MTLNIVLVEPEIPQNTGNIARTCAATGSKLHLVKPLGFSVDDRYLKRAGLDYWNDVDITYHESFDVLRKQYSEVPFYYCTTKAVHSYIEIDYPDDCFLVFGKETAGLPKKLLEENKDNTIRIPMLNNIRSLNLANSVAIITYEVLRQKKFAGFENFGKLRDTVWRII